MRRNLPYNKHDTCDLQILRAAKRARVPYKLTVTTYARLIGRFFFFLRTEPRDQAASVKAQATEACRRVDAEKSALETRAALLAPQFLSLEGGKADLENARREGDQHKRPDLLPRGSKTHRDTAMYSGLSFFKERTKTMVRRDVLRI